MQTLTNLEYNLVIQALLNAQDLHEEGDFVDPYAENEEKYTDDDFTQALKSAHDKIRENYLASLK